MLTAFQPAIELEYFDFVGGKDMFEEECGGIRSLPEKYSDATYAKAVKVLRNVCCIYICMFSNATV